MADIRINSLPTTASASSSDDFLALDGATNGTRKLNAYSPTFGGNLTVSGTGTSSVAGVFKAGTDIVTGDTSAFQVHNNVDDKPMVGFYRGGTLRSVLRLNTDNDFRLLSSDLSTPANLTAGNLTVSGTGGFGNTVSITKAGGAILELNDSNQTARIRTVQTGVTHDLAFHVESAEKMRLFSTGNLFIGASPVDGGQKLQVSGSIYSSSYLYSLGGFNPNGNTGAFFNSNNLEFYTSGAVALTLNSSQNATFAGKVGIGVSPASWELNLQQSAVNSAVRIISPTALGLNDSSIYIAWASGSKALIAASYESTGSYRPLVLSAGGVDSLTLDTSGNATFAGKVTLNGAYTSTTSAALNISGVSIPGITLQTTSGSGRNFFIGSNYSSAGILTFSGSSSAGGAATTQLVNLDATNEVVKIPLSTASTTTGSGALQVSGGAGVTGAVNVGTYYGMVDGVTAPAATSGYAKIYVDTADGDLKVIFGDGTVKTIVTD